MKAFNFPQSGGFFISASLYNPISNISLSVKGWGLLIQHQRHHQHQQLFIFILVGWLNDTGLGGC